MPFVISFVCKLGQQLKVVAMVVACKKYFMCVSVSPAFPYYSAGHIPSIVDTHSLMLISTFIFNEAVLNEIM